ncbi:hypothetical protein [Elizabethkingia meningoseptica]|uniref:hypothetical protein n=1 Tax=Elizabethkingia meningoseptica TaxID=238 RepID=UPI0023B15895|nr:hypothetical protein [Elizabethkingia meningoseptica]MDE5492553.1 hypothetical protein [Elizabethkingia meningoseptica]
MKNATIIASFLWIGFLCAISFMEAWLKFRAQGVTLPIGLSIGKIVFTALNKMEWFFAIIIIAGLVAEKVSFLNWRNTSIAIPLLLLLLQTLWLLPILNERATLQIQGQIVPVSNLHFFYVAMELIKVVSLFVFGIYLLSK